MPRWALRWDAPFCCAQGGGRRKARGEATGQEAKSRCCIFLLVLVTLAEEKSVECHHGGPRDGGFRRVKQPKHPPASRISRGTQGHMDDLHFAWRPLLTNPGSPPAPIMGQPGRAAKLTMWQPIGSQIFTPPFRHAGLSLTYPFSGFCPGRGVCLFGEWGLAARIAWGHRTPNSHDACVGSIPSTTTFWFFFFSWSTSPGARVVHNAGLALNWI